MLLLADHGSGLLLWELRDPYSGTKGQKKGPGVRCDWARLIICFKGRAKPARSPGRVAKSFCLLGAPDCRAKEDGERFIGEVEKGRGGQKKWPPSSSSRVTGRAWLLQEKYHKKCTNTPRGERARHWTKAGAEKDGDVEC